VSAAEEAERSRELVEAEAPPLSPDLSIVHAQVYRGPNYYSYEPAIKLLVDLGSLEYWPSNTIDGFTDELLAILPGVGEHSCSRGHAGGFRERLIEGTWAGHVAEHIAIELQRESVAQVYRGKTRGSGAPGRYHVIYGYWEEQVGLAAGRIAVRLVNHLVSPDSEFDLFGELEALIRLAEERAFGPSTQAILDEAASRDIPFIRLNEQSLVQLGQGKYQQRIRATMTSMTSALAVDIAQDKRLTNQLLASAGLPVPRSEVVRSADEALSAAKRIGYPVVAKPLDGNHGRGSAWTSARMTTPARRSIAR
jgi:cyanophycin synthetase